MGKPVALWIDDLVASRHEEPPPFLVERFAIRSVASGDDLAAVIEDAQPDCIFFDFDYPDRRRLSRFAEVKERYPSIPIVLVTLQHSESLAVWSYRHGALDYLVKPLQHDELTGCVDRIESIVAMKRLQSQRKARLSTPPVPKDIALANVGKQDKMLPAVYYVKRNYSQRIYSDAMARLCNMSATHFSRAFKQTYGLTFQEFLLKYRVIQACRRLHVPSVSISDVGYAVGFSDPSYFSRIFRRFVGMAPSEYASAKVDEREQIDKELGLEEQDTSASQTVRSLTNLSAIERTG